MPASPESKTDTTSNASIEQSFAKAVALLQAIENKLSDVNKELGPLPYWLKVMKESDLLLEYKVVAHTKTGEVFNIEGINNIPRIFDESMLPEAPSNFESIFNASVVRPALSAFMQHMRGKIEDLKKLQLPSTIPEVVTAAFTDNSFISE